MDQHAHQNGSPRRPNAPNELKSTRTAGNLTSASAGRRLPTTRPVRRRASPRRRERVEPGLRRCRAARSHQRGQVELRQRGVGGHERELLVGHDILHARRQRVLAGRALQQQVRCRPATHVNETEDEVGRPAAAGDGALSPTRNEHLHTVASSPAREPSVPARAWARARARPRRPWCGPASQSGRAAGRASDRGSRRPGDGPRRACRGMKMAFEGSVRSGPNVWFIRDRGLLWENADG